MSRNCRWRLTIWSLVPCVGRWHSRSLLFSSTRDINVYTTLAMGFRFPELQTDTHTHTHTHRHRHRHRDSPGSHYGESPQHTGQGHTLSTFCFRDPYLCVFVCVFVFECGCVCVCVCDGALSHSVVRSYTRVHHSLT